MIKKMLARIAVIGVVLTAMVVPSTGAQAADIGDGLLACSVGEICFKKHNDSNWTQYVKHFWYTDRNHDDNNFSGNGGMVGENASMYWNRDTECTVNVLDYVPVLGLWDYYSMHQGASWYKYFGSGWNDENDGHVRCGW